MFYQLYHGGDIRVDFAADSGDTQAGNYIEEALRLFGDHRNSVFRSGGDQGDQGHAVFPAQAAELALFLERKIGKDQAVDADLGAG